MDQVQTMDLIRQYLPLIIPLLAIQIILMVVTLFDLVHREIVRGPKWLWALIIIFGQMIGPIAYIFIGRRDE